jgi:hypothetical protein
MDAGRMKLVGGKPEPVILPASVMTVHSAQQTRQSDECWLLKARMEAFRTFGLVRAALPLDLWLVLALPRLACHVRETAALRKEQTRQKARP